MLSGILRSMAAESRSAVVTGAVLLTFHLDFTAESGTMSSSSAAWVDCTVCPCRDVRLSCGAAKAQTQNSDAIMILSLFNCLLIKRCKATFIVK